MSDIVLRFNHLSFSFQLLKGWVTRSLCLVSIFLFFTSNSSAQPKVILGDTDVVLNYDLTSHNPSCLVEGINYRGPYWTNALSFYWGNQSIWAVCIGNYIGVIHDTALFEVFYDFSCYYSDSHQFLRLDANAAVVPDSLVLIRPKSWTVDLYFDTVAKEWYGNTSPNFLNNVNTKTTFNEWHLEGIADSLLHMEYGPSIDSNSVVRYEANSGERRRLGFHFHSTHGSSYNAITYSGILRTHVRNADMDSMYSNAVTFVLHPVPFQYGVNLSVGEATINTPATTATVVLHPYPLPKEVVVEQLRYPFYAQLISHAKEGEGVYDSLRITCVAKTSGHYSDLIPIRYIFKDQVGNPHTVTKFLKVSANLKIEDPIEWQATSFLPDPAFDTLFVMNDGTVCEVGSNGFSYSSDSGQNWILKTINNVHKIRGEIIRYTDSTGVEYQVAGLFGIMDNLLVRSLDTGTTWLPITKGLLVTAMETPGDYPPRNVPADAYQASIDRKGILYLAAKKQSFDYAHWRDFNHTLPGYVTKYFKSTDLGTTWIAIDSTYSDAGPTLPLAIDPNGQVIYNPKGYYRDIDLQDTSIITKVKSICFVGSENKGSFYQYEGTDHGLFSYNPQTSQWRYNGFVDVNIVGLAATTNNTIYAATADAGVLRSADSGLTWNYCNGGLRSMDANAIASGPNNEVYVYLKYSGIYRLLQPEKNFVAEAPGNGKMDMSLQLYPNPANSIVRMAYPHLENEQPQLLEVFNALGKRCFSKQRITQQASADWNTIDLASLQPGLYFLRLYTSRSTYTGNLIIKRP